MTRPKGKLFALLAIFLAIGIVTATGAFTSVSAERTVEATVDSDANAIVGLAPYDGPNGWGDGDATNGSDGYADINNGVLEINLGGYSGGSPEGNSVNYNATSKFDFVFNISNQASDDFTYYITRNGQAAGAENTVVFYNGTVDSGANVTGTFANAQTLGQGETDQISIEVDLTGIDNNDVSEGTSLIDSITIHAESV